MPLATLNPLGAAGYNGFNQTKFAMLAAVPVDFTMSRLRALRVEPGIYMTSFNKEKQGNFRLSIGQSSRSVVSKSKY